jgi:hypothetical protein
MIIMATSSHYSNVNNLRRLHSYGVKHACAWPVQLCFFSELSGNQGILSGSASHVNPLIEKADFIPVPYNIMWAGCSGHWKRRFKLSDDVILPLLALSGVLLSRHRRHIMIAAESFASSSSYPAKCASNTIAIASAEWDE